MLQTLAQGPKVGLEWGWPTVALKGFFLQPKRGMHQRFATVLSYRISRPGVHYRLQVAPGGLAEGKWGRAGCGKASRIDT